MKTNTAILITALLALGSGLPAHSDDITLKRSVRIRHAEGAILLRDIARIEGDYANRFGEVQVALFNDRTRPVEIGIDEIAVAMERAGANRALFDLSGSRVIVRPYARANSQTMGPEACAPLKINQAPAVATSPTEQEPSAPSKDIIVLINPRTVVGEDTPRGLIADRFSPHWRDTDDPVRLRIETRMPDLLHVEGSRPTVTATDTTAEGVVTFRIDLAGEYAGSVVATLEMKSVVHRTRMNLKRGHRVNIEDINMRSEWTPLYRIKGIAATSMMIGSKLDTAVSTNTILEPAHFAPIVERNTPISVRSGGSGWSMVLDCIALEDGRLGDMIEVRTHRPGVSSRDAKTIRVVVEDAGHATLLN